MQIRRFDEVFSVCKVADVSQVDLTDRFCFVGKTDGEISVVCALGKVPADALARDDGWRMFRIVGTLDFSLIGILARISSLLAEHGISIFAVSTYDTDYVLVKEASYEGALATLMAAGYEVVG